MADLLRRGDVLAALDAAGTEARRRWDKGEPWALVHGVSLALSHVEGVPAAAMPDPAVESIDRLAAYLYGEAGERYSADAVVDEAMRRIGGQRAAPQPKRCPMTCPHGDRCTLEQGHGEGCNHRGCDCNEPNTPQPDTAPDPFVPCATCGKPTQYTTWSVSPQFCPEHNWRPVEMEVWVHRDPQPDTGWRERAPEAWEVEAHDGGWMVAWDDEDEGDFGWEANCCIEDLVTIDDVVYSTREVSFDQDTAEMYGHEPMVFSLRRERCRPVTRFGDPAPWPVRDETVSPTAQASDGSATGEGGDRG